MSKFGTIVATALVAAGTGWISFGQPVYLHAQEAKVEMEVKAPNSADAPNVDAKADQSAARRVLAQATKAAIGPNALQGVSETLTASDRDRIRSSKTDTQQLEATAAQLREDWKAKYGSDLAITNPDVSMNYTTEGNDKLRGANSGPQNASSGADNRAGARIAPAANPNGPEVAGVIVNPDQPENVTVNPEPAPARLPAGPVAAGVQRTTDAPRTQIPNTNDAQPAGARIDTDTTANSELRTNSNAMPRGTVSNDANSGMSYSIPANAGAGAVSLPLAEENGAVKINIDDSIDANRLASNLNHHLKMVCDMKANWPSDVNEAQRTLAHHVAAALTDTTTPVKPAAQ